jgi:hypothetical protein
MMTIKVVLAHVLFFNKRTGSNQPDQGERFIGTPVCRGMAIRRTDGIRIIIMWDSK